MGFLVLCKGASLISKTLETTQKGFTILLCLNRKASEEKKKRPRRKGGASSLGKGTRCQQGEFRRKSLLGDKKLRRVPIAKREGRGSCAGGGRRCVLW